MKDSGAIVIIGLALYFLFMGYLANAAGYEAPGLGDFTQISLPGGLALLTPVVWVVGSMLSFFGLLAFNISGGGGVPLWLNAFAFLPLIFGLAWMILGMIRG